MRRWLLVAAILLVAIGCDSENKKTYEFNGYWTFAGVENMCKWSLPQQLGGDELEFETIEVKMYKDEAALEADDVYQETRVPCSDGSFTLEDVERGTYQVVVSALAADPDVEIAIDAGVDESVDFDDEGPDVRAYFDSTEEVVIPSKDDKVEFKMEFGTGSIAVSWGFESGQCASEWNQVETVKVEVKGAADEKTYDSGELPCNTTNWKVDDLSWDIYTVNIVGYDKDGKKTHEGSFDNPVEIRPGTHISGRDGLILLIEL